jgi:glycosyltransferase involved in cell wall biosynthesis
MGKKIILNVSDLWPLAAIELNALKKNSFSHKISLSFEQSIYWRANVILGQSNEIITHIHSIFQNKKCYLYRNFPDHQETEMVFETKINEPIKLFYAGLLGVAQGVYELCKNIELQKLNIELHIFGDGAEKSQIEDLIQQSRNLGTDKKIFFYDMLERNVLHKKLQTFDIAIVPLKTRIYGSVPSKIFEYGALGFPILYFGGGEGETIVRENNLGWVAQVGNFESLNSTLVAISKTGKIEIQRMKTEVFESAEHKFNLDFQIKELINKGVF